MHAVLVCTIIMGCLYGGLGAVGYWSRGDSILGIVIFSLGDTPLARFSSACILLQVGAIWQGSRTTQRIQNHIMACMAI